MKGFTRDSYIVVEFVYNDYSDFVEMFSTDWSPTEAIAWMKDNEYHEEKLKTHRVIEIKVSKVTKYEVRE